MIDEHMLDTLMATARTIGYGQIPPYQHDECFTIGAFDLVVFHCRDRGESFQLLQAVCQRYHQIKDDPKLVSGYLYLLAQLARSSDTTELPEGMKRIIEENSDQTVELREWYRLKA